MYMCSYTPTPARVADCLDLRVRSVVVGASLWALLCCGFCRETPIRSVIAQPACSDQSCDAPPQRLRLNGPLLISEPAPYSAVRP